MFLSSNRIKTIFKNQFYSKETSGTFLSIKRGTRNVWIVTVSDEIGNGENGRSTYYFDKIDRKLWEQEINANGRKMLMQLIEQ